MIKCGSCTFCCRHALIPILEEDDIKLYKTKQIAGIDVLEQKLNGDCIYLENGCLIYAIRPTLCRNFDCIGFYENAVKKKATFVLKDKHFIKAVNRAIKRNSDG